MYINRSSVGVTRHCVCNLGIFNVRTRMELSMVLAVKNCDYSKRIEEFLRSGVSACRLCEVEGRRRAKIDPISVSSIYTCV